MNVISINQNSDLLLEVPKAPVYLTDEAKKHFASMGKILCQTKRMKTIYLPALEVYAESMAQFEWAVREIRRNNKAEPGSGYIQEFKSGATNVSVYVTLKNNAISDLIHCFKLFGLDPKSDKGLKDSSDPNQTSLFEEFMARKNG
jgi:phage terminase small subunit